MLIMFTAPASAAQECKTWKGLMIVGAVNSSNGGVYEKGQYGIISKDINCKQDQLYDGNGKVDFIRPQQ